MKQEYKELLLKYISTVMPYGIFCDIGLEYPLPPQRMFIDKLDGVLFDFYEDGKNYQVYLSEIKPYLRSMSSMTEEECKELGELPATINNISETFPNTPYYIEVAKVEQINWLLERHFDFCGLIEKGLAIEVTKENNPY